ncbi:MAG: class II aldolase/adducin family protein [Gemmatimonadetes bacterium]|nr:class II aldolase/adducin family protein [Gemmatimonadota bacterium]
MSAILEELVGTARGLSASGLVTGAGGNVSAREGGGMWISPSGFSLGEAAAADYPCVDIDSGEIVSPGRRPSSEVLMHLGIYRARPELEAVIHTHPRTAIALTAAGHDLRPMFADYYVYLGPNVPHVDYVTVTTPELAAAVTAGFADPGVVGMVLRNHGSITVGASIKEALYRSLAIEEQADIQWRALQVGTPAFLSEKECARLDELGSEEYRRRLLAEMKTRQDG